MTIAEEPAAAAAWDQLEQQAQNYVDEQRQRQQNRSIYLTGVLCRHITRAMTTQHFHWQEDPEDDDFWTLTMYRETNDFAEWPAVVHFEREINEILLDRPFSIEEANDHTIVIGFQAEPASSGLSQ
jgi:hypothetical protein